MEQNHCPWESDSRSADQRNFQLSWNPKVHALFTRARYGLRFVLSSPHLFKTHLLTSWATVASTLTQTIRVLVCRRSARREWLMRNPSRTSSHSSSLKAVSTCLWNSLLPIGRSEYCVPSGNAKRLQVFVSLMSVWLLFEPSGLCQRNFSGTALYFCYYCMLCNIKYDT